MAQLSGILKRNFPAVREAVGSIRRWIDTHDEFFRLEKWGGKWMIVLIEVGNGNDQASMQEETEPSYYGVDKLVYFRMSKPTLALLRKTSDAIDAVLQARLLSADAVPEEHNIFVDAIMHALAEAHMYPNKA